MSDGFAHLDGAGLLRLGAGAINGWLVLLIGAQGAALGAVLGALCYMFVTGDNLFLTSRWIPGGLAVLGAFVASALAGVWVLGGWRGARRATFVVAIGAACGWGTSSSPLIIDQRPGGAWPFGVAAAFMAAAAGGVAMLRPGAPRPPIDLVAQAPAGAPADADEA